ncbi:aldose 1-epimerase family protein [Aegicerativicinus sediminis]|uniref:aldose 1-epimerase family protein n=1 Tax=Aegicerativicinus sediminis TaxID=2893202 RepID=UPI001E56BB53|nr:aldose 1-epimerase family protein [Aegicerativicinus sediminis]
MNNPSVYTISKNGITAKILTKGAELYSLTKNGLEYMWQADPDHWNRHSPVLFPIVGPLIDKEYFYEGENYSLPQHGFARDLEFEAVEVEDDHIIFQQKENANTLKMYPFSYVLQLHYRITENGLDVGYVVKNTNSKTLYFSIGAHPAFSCPFEDGQKRSEYQLVFDKQLMPEAIDKNEEGKFYIDSTYKVMDEPGIMELPDGKFDDGSITFNPNPFSKVKFVHKPTNKDYLSVTFKNFPYLGIWSAKDAPFICIEPWHGIADNTDHTKEFTQKEGIVALEPKENFKFSFSIEIL